MDFVENWTIVQTLGEGAYGEVKLLVNKLSRESVAMKMIDLKRHPGAEEAAKKESVIHKALVHPHIIRYYGRRRHGLTEYMFLEYAPHGELFDRIEPDVGMSQWEAQKYMKQLMSGVQYLHSHGVAHRDLKPENLLLDQSDNIKISDFGMATIFRAAGKERALDKRCGTLPYVAPEVLQRTYAAQPADIWSCGIVLVAMLAGELPWDEASLSCSEYRVWASNKASKTLTMSPWNKLDTEALALLRHILCKLPSARYSPASILQHRWCKRKFSPVDPPVNYETEVKKKLLELQEEDGAMGSGPCFFSQPPPPPSSSPFKNCSSKSNGPSCISTSHKEQEIRENDKKRNGCDYISAVPSFSQPTILQDLLISTQQIFTQSPSNQNSLQKLVRRMTRFLVKLTVSECLEELEATLDNLKLPFKICSSSIVTITTVDRRKSCLVIKVNILNMEDSRTLVDFRLSKGDGLEFKRHFISIRSSFQRFILPVNLADLHV